MSFASLRANSCGEFMSDIIKLLPDSIANQIAAGEVVQRPASVVKELLENSLDAGADSVQLVVKDAGKLLVQVIDDGMGMSETDARMCFERHATSKINKADDLFTLKSFGFRGEAMASIAAVAQVELKTRKIDNELGLYLRVEASEIKQQEAVATPKGTSIAVKNLFFNVPARRNFLKSNPVELKHIMDEFQRVALAFPGKAFGFFQNDLEVYNLAPENLSKRIVNLFGNSYKEQLISCQEDTEFMKVRGYMGKPESAKKTRGEQFFFVNQRFIKSSYLHHAVMAAYEDLLDDQQFPFYVLFIEVDPKHIDVNVHPTKTEIKFDDERTVYGIIKAAVKKSLATHNIAPAIDFDLNINFDSIISPYGHSNQSKEHTKQHNPSYSQIEKKGNDWQKIFNQFENRENIEKMKHEEENTGQHSITMQSAINGEVQSGTTPLNKDLLYTENTSTFQLHNRYIVTQVKSGMVIIDQQAAHERILYEKYIAMLHKKFGASQQFLFPQSLELNPSDFSLVMEMEEEIKAMGFVFNVFGTNTIVVNGIPADIQSGREKDLFEGLIEQFKQNDAELKLERRENLARAMAKRSSIRQGTKLTQAEMNALIDQLFACKTPNYAPNGNHTIVMMDLDKIGRLFS